MKIDLLDYILADPSCSLADAVDIISHFVVNEEKEVLTAINSDLEHAFSDSF